MKLPQLTFGRVLAGTVLVLVATTGTAYAAATIGSADIIDDSIRSVDLKNETIKSVDILNGTVRSADVMDGNLTSADIADGTITSLDVLDGSLLSADLAAGAVRASDLGTITQRSATSANIPAGGNGSVTASCLAGEQVLSGGNDGFFDVFVVASRRSGNGWAVFAHNNSGGNRTVTAHAYCLAS